MAFSSVSVLANSCACEAGYLQTRESLSHDKLTLEFIVAHPEPIHFRRNSLSRAYRGVIFTFILFMKELPRILEMVSTIAPLRQRCGNHSFHDAQLFHDYHSMRYWWGAAGLSRLAADSEIIAMRASGLGIGYFVRVPPSLPLAARSWDWPIRSIWHRAPIRQF